MRLYYFGKFNEEQKPWKSGYNFRSSMPRSVNALKNIANSEIGMRKTTFQTGGNAVPFSD